MTRAEAWVGSGHRVAVPRPPGEGAGRHRSSENPEMREPGGRPLIRRRHPERTEGRPVPPRLNRAGRAAPWPGRACPGVTALPAPRHFPEPEPQTDSLRGSPRCPRPSAHLSAWTEFLPQGPQSPWPLPKAARPRGTFSGSQSPACGPRGSPSLPLSHVCPGGWRVRMLLPAQLALGVREVRPTRPHAHTPG